MKFKTMGAALLTMLLLTSCGESETPQSAPEEQTTTTIAQLVVKEPELPEGSERVESGRISYEVKLAWKLNGPGGTYIDSQTRSAYMFITAGQDKALSPQEILDSYIEQTGAQITDTQPLSEELTDSSGLKYRTAMLVYSSKGNTNALRFIFWEEQNYYAVFKGEAAYEQNRQDMLDTLTALCDSVELTPTGEDIITGNTVSVSDIDSFDISFNADGSFTLDQGDYNADGVRIEGSYKVLRSTAALDELSGYTETFETLDLAAERKKMLDCEDLFDYYAVVLECETVLRWGEVVNTKAYTRLMTGTRTDENTLEMYDYKTYSAQVWNVGQ
ncbi:MAG: hypothetical protein IJ561_06595 [Ruminococcus sp.]|nr:hypothetical protein [Ruminococcus sp.]